MAEGSSRRRFMGLALVTLISTITAAPLMAQAQPTTTPASLRERAEASRAKGAASAPVLVYEIADFQCPYCSRFARDVFPSIDAEYVKTGRVKWVFVNLPLPSHAHGWAAAEAALCAGAVADRFWQFHDRLFADQNEWTDTPDPTPHFAAYARDLEIPADAFLSCIQRDAVALLILEDVIAAATSQVTGTPAFVIDNQDMVVGLKSIEEWRALLDRALRRKR
ncbi:MAG: thioredoxin domain-containing protein [Longimicrobiales bacterium]